MTTAYAQIYSSPLSFSFLFNKSNIINSLSKRRITVSPSSPLIYLCYEQYALILI